MAKKQNFLPDSVRDAARAAIYRASGAALFLLGLWFCFVLIFHNPALDGFMTASSLGRQSLIGNFISFCIYGIGFIPSLFVFLFLARCGISMMLRWESLAPEFDITRAFITTIIGAFGFGAIAVSKSWGGVVGAIAATDIGKIVGGLEFLFGILFIAVFCLMAGILLHIKWSDVRAVSSRIWRALRWGINILRLRPISEPDEEETAEEEADEEEIEEEPKPRRARAKKTAAVVADSAPDDIEYELPPPSLLTRGALAKSVITPELRRLATMLEAHIEEFGIDGKIVGIRPGPVVTIYEFEPGQGVRTAKITDIAEDLKVRMSAEKVRIAHISGTNVIGIELPNLSRQPVLFRPLVENEKFEDSPFAVPLALGVNVSGEPFYFDLTKMIHLLIAGHTGTGKSVFVQSIIMSLLYKFAPDECRLIIIDPKGLDFGVFDDIAHLMCPIIKNDPAKSVNALKWAVREMDERYAKMQQLGGVLKISEYNEKIEELVANGETITRQVAVGTDPETGALEFETQEIPLEKIPYLVLIVDEVADLMSLARKEVEACVQRLAAKARAAGIHLILATQRPDTSVITGTIKANFPARISFQAFSSIDSKTSLGQTGAEQLLPFGDMLLSDNGKAAVRVHTPLVSHKDMKNTCDFIRKQLEPSYVEGIGDNEGEGGFAGLSPAIPGMPMGKGDKDADLYRAAVEYVVRDKKPTISYVQRRLGVGYNKAAGFIERMECEGILSAPDANNKRQIL